MGIDLLPPSLKVMKPNSVIPPLLFGWGVETDHAIGSETLNSLSFVIAFPMTKSKDTSSL